jgi:hypothetical protein
MSNYNRTIAGIIAAVLMSGAVTTKGGSAEDTAVALVRNGQALALIVIPDGARPFERVAAEDFAAMLSRASGAALEIVRESSVSADGRARVYVGDTRRAERRGMTSERLQPEQFRVFAGENEVILTGALSQGVRGELPASQPLSWAVGEVLERDLGVRWLWPGRVGTYVPERASVSIAPSDLTLQPRLEFRQFRNQHIRKLDRTLRMSRDGRPHVDTPPDLYTRLSAEMDDWLRFHRVGTRSDFRFGHAFTGWWNKYSAMHPDLFAEPPAGAAQPYPAADRVKLRLANPKVLDFILQEWRAAGRPFFWNVCPNDGSGFDTSPETMAWDHPPGQPPTDVWNGPSQLTARYVHFWNRLIRAMRTERPDAELCTYAYSRYADPPPEGLRLEQGIVIGIVPTYDEEFYVQWDGWNRAGATRMVLRPNWLNHGANAPYLPLQEMAAAIRHAVDHGMAGALMSGAHGAWGTTGLESYMVMRLMARPELELKTIVDEYCSAFGEAEPLVRTYFDYWMQFSSEAAYPFPRGGDWRRGRGGRYEQAVRENDLTFHITNRGKWHVMPYLYPDEVLGPAFALLDRAAQAVAGAGGDAALRVQFLRDGLEDFRLTRDAVAAGLEAGRNPNAESRARHEQAYRELRAWRAKVSPTHAVWGDSLFGEEGIRDARTFPRGTRRIAAEDARQVD